jgi:4-nitrophenyl phosphatase
MTTFKDIRAFIVDMDGVIWRGKKILPGVRGFFRLLETHNLPFLVATNNSTVIPEQISSKFAKLDIHLKPEQVVTSSSATARFIGRTYPEIKRVYCIGEEGLQRALTSQGFGLTEGADEAQAVVVGFDYQINWSKLEEATLAIVNGAHFIGTNPDPSIPTERGLAPGNGAILAALRAATNVDPCIVGKPEPHLYRMATEWIQTEPHQTLVIGDRLETDIAGGIRAGMPTCLVLTGVSRREDLEASAVQPDWVFNNLTEIAAKLRRERL